jgi:hypothetical protein
MTNLLVELVVVCALDSFEGAAVVGELEEGVTLRLAILG